MSKLQRDDRPALPSQRPPGREEAAADPGHGEDTVVCFFSGKRVPRHEAIRVRLGPGRRVWMLAEYCRDG